MSSSSPGMRTSALRQRRRAPGLAKSARCDDKRLYVTLEDGRVVSTPLTPRLRKATRAQRKRWRIEGFGTWIHWPDIDEDLHVAHVIGIPEDELDEFAGFSSEPFPQAKPATPRRKPALRR